MTRKEIMRLSDATIDARAKIQGTDYDRKRVVTKKLLKKIEKLQGNGKSVSFIANKLGIDSKTVRYNTDPAYRAMRLEKASGKHTGTDYITADNRIAYKRKLLLNKKIYIK